MSGELDLTAAIEAAITSVHGPALTTHPQLATERAIIKRAITAAAPIIEAAARADERAKTAEDIARAIETECQRTDVMVISGWGDGMADAAAIAWKHAKETS